MPEALPQIAKSFEPGPNGHASGCDLLLEALSGACLGFRPVRFRYDGRSIEQHEPLFLCYLPCPFIAAVPLSLVVSEFPPQPVLFLFSRRGHVQPATQAEYKASQQMLGDNQCVRAVDGDARRCAV